MSTKQKDSHTKKRGRSLGAGIPRKLLSIIVAISMVIMLPTTASLFADQVIAPSPDMVDYGDNTPQAPSLDSPAQGAAPDSPGTQGGQAASGTVTPAAPSAPASPAPEARAATGTTNASGQGTVGIMPLSAPAAGGFDINQPLGGGTIDTGDTGSIVVIGEGAYNVSPGTAAGLDSALAYLATCASGDYVLYIGPTTGFALSAAAQATGFKNLSNVGTLVITGSATDPNPATPAPATAAGTSGILGTGQAVNFGCNVILRNVRYNLSNVYMNGYDLTLGNQSWATSATYYCGGAANGTVTVPASNANGTADMVVWSTGTGESDFVGGMYTGTMNGNVSITINNTSGNVFDVWGAGFGTSATATATLNGTATTTITGMATNANGLNDFVGGVYYGNVTGKITNTINGPGRLSGTGPNSGLWSDSNNAICSYIGGSRYGDIGTVIPETNSDQEASRAQMAYSDDYIIKNDVDFSAYTYGAIAFAGVNSYSGTVKGNVINIVKSGTFQKGSLNNFMGVGSLDVPAASTNYALGTWDNTTGTLSGMEASAASAEGLCAFKYYGNATSIVRAGCVAYDSGAYYQLRGAGGRGFLKGSFYTVAGSEGLVYGGNDSTKITNGDITYNYSNSTTGGNNTLGVNCNLELCGGGGYWDATNNVFIYGNTTLVQKNVLGKYTYGGLYGGSQIGDSRNELWRGVVDTLEGSGYQGYQHQGNSSTYVYGGEVDWFLSGGGWDDNYQSGNASVTVYDNPRTRLDGTPVTDPATGKTLPAVIINASMGGTYGASSTHYIGGNSSVTVYGGDFSGTARTGVARGFSTAPSNAGKIFGSGTMTLDFRGNQYGFMIENGDSVSGGRRLDTAQGSGNIYLGNGPQSTITLNIFSDASSNANLNGLNIYGDAATGSTSQTNVGKITMNINAPGATIGNVYATNYANVTGSGTTATLGRDVEINLVSAGQIQGLSAGNNSTAAAQSITNTVKANAASQGKAAKLNVGPQDQPAGWDEAAQGPWILANEETAPTADGYPYRINVGTNGIMNFTEMNVNKRLLTAAGGSVKNGGAVTVTNYGATYQNTGNVTLVAGNDMSASGFGATGTGSAIFVGPITVQGAGEAYIQSPGGENQVVTSSVSIPSGDEMVWLKNGGATTPPALGTATSRSTWFGQQNGYKVITFIPTASNAKVLTPANFRGEEEATGKTYIGDNFVPATGSGFGVTVPGTFYKWNVVDGPDGISLGSVVHNVEGASTTEPTGDNYLLVYGTSAAGVPSKSGSLAIPSSNIPGQVPWPQFSFVPDEGTGEWVASLDILRSDQYVNKVPASNPRLADSNPLNDGLGNYNEGVQSQADYNTAANRTRAITMGTSNPAPTAANYPATRTPASLGNTNDVEYSFDMAVDYTFVAELDASNVTLTESQAAALFGGSLSLDEKVQNVVDATNAAGRPFFDMSDITQAKLDQLAAPLGADSYRQVPVTYKAGTTAQLKTKTVKITIVPDDSVIIGPYVLIAVPAEVTVGKAHAITDQYQNADGAKDLDTYTKALVINTDADPVETVHPDLANAAGTITQVNTSVAGQVIDPVTYTFTGTWTGADGNPVTETGTRSVVVTITAGSPPAILINGNYDPATPEADRDASLTYQTDPLVIPLGTGEVTESELLAGVTGIDGEDGTVAVAVQGMAGVHIQKSVPGVSQVTYTTTDSDLNTATRARAVVVGDAVVGKDYILMAKGFVIGKSAAADTAILPTSEATVWRTDGSTDATLAPYVKSKGSYTDASGTYQDIVIGVMDSGTAVDAPSAGEATITAKVYTDPTGTEPADKVWNYNGANGQVYSITAKHIRMNLTDAQALQGLAQAGFESSLVTSTEATAYKRADWASGSTVSLASDGGFKDATLAGGQAYELTFRVAADPTAEVAVILLVDNGNPPALTVPPMKQVNVGDPFPEGATGDSTPSYMQGVSATDVEDGPLAASGITHSGSVDTQVAGLYTVTYSVTDSEYNTSTAVGYVLVNDGSFIYDPTTKYLVQAYDFFQTVENTAATWNNTEILSLSYAKAWDLGGNAPVEVSPYVMASANYTNAPGTYAPIRITPAGQTAPERDITATVVDKDELDQGKNPDDPTDSATYVIGANHVDLLVSQARSHDGLSADNKTWLATQAKAEAWKILGATEAHGVDVVSNGLPANPVAGNTYQVTFCPTGVPSITVTVDFVIGGTEPKIDFVKAPLVIQQQKGAEVHNLTADEIKDYMTVVDAEDGTLIDDTTYLIDSTPGKTISTGVVAVYSVAYSVTDSDGMSATATRAIIVDDGRYVIDPDNELIIGAKNFVIAKNTVTGAEDQVRTYSRAYAYDITGHPVGGLTAVPLPEGYGASGQAGDYQFVWHVAGKPTEKQVTGTVTDADVIFPGNDNDQYAMTANNFQVNTTDAAAMLQPDLNASLMDKTGVQVIKLVDAAPDATVRPISNSGFTNVEGTYPITFGAQTAEGNVITTPATQVTVNGVVSDGNKPVITAPTPIEIWVGAGEMPGTAITPDEYNNDPLYKVTAWDVEDEDLTSAVVAIPDASPVPTDPTAASVGIYTYKYDVTDSDHRAADSVRRAIVVNDGTYVVGQGRILKAQSFVTRLQDVTSSADGVQDEILANSKATLYNGTTGSEIGLVGNLAGISTDNYGKAVGVYNIVINAVDNPASAPSISKAIVGEVVDADVIGPDAPSPSGPTTYVYGKNIDQSISEANATAAGGSTAILEALKAYATKTSPQGLQNTYPAVKIVNDLDGYLSHQTDTDLNNDVGTFRFDVSDVDGATTIRLTIRVGNGPVPVVTAAPKPLNVPIASTPGDLTRTQLMVGVDATDATLAAPDNWFDVSAGVVVSIVDVTGGQPGTAVDAIPGDKAGVYSVTYTYTDEDRNTAFDTRAVIVNDGSIKYNEVSIIRALSFVIRASDVSTAQSRTQILAQSQAQGWDITGAPKGVDISSDGSYAAVGGHDYIATLVVPGSSPLLTKDIVAKVLSDGTPSLAAAGDQNGANGTHYSVVANNFRINVTDANALVAQAGTAAYANTFFSRSGLMVYDRTALAGFPEAPATTKELVSDGGFAAAGSQPLKQGDVFTITLRCAEDPGAATTIKAFVDNAQPPAITAPVRLVWAGDPDQRPEGTIALADWNAQNGLYGVTVTDDFDSQSSLMANLKVGSVSGGSFTEGNPVSTAKLNVWQDISYQVTDSDHNTTTKTVKVMVTDKAPMGDYLVIAYDFVETVQNVAADGNGTDQILGLADAHAWRWKTTNPAEEAQLPLSVDDRLTVLDDAGYQAEKGAYAPIEVSVNAEPGYSTGTPGWLGVTGTVVDKDAIDGSFVDADNDGANDARYYVGADNAALTYAEASTFVGLGTAAKANLADRASAEAWETFSGITDAEVDVVSNQIGDGTHPIKAGDSYEVVFSPKGVPSVQVTVTFTIQDAPPVIVFDADPLVLQQTSESHIVTQDQLKAEMSVTDLPDGPLLDKTTAVVAGGIPLDQRNIGVYKVEYSVTDSSGQTSTAYRAVVIDDGRYVIDQTNNVIIGARDYVIKRTGTGGVDGTQDQARNASYAEAFVAHGTIPGDDTAGNPLTVTWSAQPEGYVSGAEAGDYPITWQATYLDGTVAKDVTAHVVDADAVSPGNKDSQYALVASNFQASISEAEAIVAGDPGTYIGAAKAKVITLVDGAQPRDVLVVDRAGFAAALATYSPIQFRIDGIPFAAQGVGITGTVSETPLPALTVPTPVNVWIGDPSARPAGSVLPGDYSDLYGVVAQDYQGNDLISQVQAAPDASTGAVDLSKAGRYGLSYSVTDADHNTAAAARVVVVNDGRYAPGSRILRASSFVTRLADVTTAPANINGEVLAKSSAALFNGQTGAVVSGSDMYVADNGGYTASPYTYDITINGRDASEPPDPDLVRTVKGEVVDTQAMASSPSPKDPDLDTYYVFGNNIELRVSAAQDILNAPDPGAALITALGAGSRLATASDIQALTPAVTDDGGLKAVENTEYTVTVADPGRNVSISLTVKVQDSPGPAIVAAPTPLNITWDPASTANLTRDQVMAGVTATHPIDGDLTGSVVIDPNAAGVEQLPAIPLNAGGVYQVTYKVTDKDGKTAQVSRAIIVNDGSITYDSKYILRGRSFVTTVADVAAAGADIDTFILANSNARAWTAQGGPATAVVANNVSMSASEGDYHPVLAVYENIDTQRTVTAKVVPDTHVPDPGETYAIDAQGFRINLTDAAALQAMATTDPAGYAAQLIARAAAVSYLRTSQNLNVGGTVAMTDDGGFKTAAFAQEGDPDYPTKVPITFWVDEDHTATTTIMATVSNGNHPTIDAPIRFIWAGDPSDPDRTAGSILLSDWNAQNGLNGVTANDQEDGTLTSQLKVGSVSGAAFTAGNPVDTAKLDVYQDISYQVTDSDHNTVTKTGKVMVTKNAVRIGAYAVYGYDFVENVANVAANGTGASTILGLAAAKADRVETVTPAEESLLPIAVNNLLTVKDDGGYQAQAGDYPIQVTVNPEPLYTAGFNYDAYKGVTGRVVEKDAINGAFVDTDSNGAYDGRYYVAADNAMIPLDEARNYVGLGAGAKGLLIQAAQAAGWETMAGIQGYDVDVASNQIGDADHPVVANGTYQVTFIPRGVPSVPVTVTFTINQGGIPDIEFQQEPLVVQQSATDQYLTQDQLKAAMTAWDAEDHDLLAQTTAAPAGGPINQRNIGVYQVSYTVTDSDGNSAAKTRAVVIDDGRFTVDKAANVIIGARDYVLKSTGEGAVDGTEDQARSASYAEAFVAVNNAGTADIAGTPLAVNWAGNPADIGYVSAADPGDYGITWQATNGAQAVQKQVVAHIVDATDVSPGGRDSQYAIVASDFQRDLEGAQAIVTGGDAAYIAAANAQVIKLVAAAQDRSVLVESRAGFQAVQGAYSPIQFRIEGIPATTQVVRITGTVSQGDAPVIHAQTPLEVWVGDDPNDPERAAYSVLPSQYSDLYDVTATDTEDGTITSAVTVAQDPVKGSVVATKDGVGTYTLAYSVTDSNNNTVTQTRVVAVNDGSLTIGGENSRILSAKGFVTAIGDVPTNAALLDTDIKNKSTALLQNGETGATIPSSDITVASRGTTPPGYRAAVGVYDITLNGVNVAPNPALTRTITGEVVDATVIGSGPNDPMRDNYFVFGNPISLRIGEAQTILAGGDSALIDALGAGARKAVADGSIQDLTPVITDHGGFAAAQGTYDVKVADPDGNVTITLRVTVSEGNAPAIAATPTPLNITWDPNSTTALTRDQIMSGVKATDEEAKATANPDGDITGSVVINPNAAGVEQLPAIPLNHWSVTPITYKVTDSDGNTAEVTRALIVNDGSIRYDDKYVVRAQSFIIKATDVVQPYEALILSQSSAQAWNTAGAPATARVSSTGGFAAQEGDYSPTIGIQEYGGLSRAITARVIATGNPGNGDTYAINAKDFRINLTDAAALQAMATSDPAGYAAALISKASAESFLRADVNLGRGGTVAMTNDGGFKTAVFAQEGAAGYPTQVPIAFWVDEDHTATTTIMATVSNGNHPWVTVPSKQVDLGATFGEAQYLEGVTYGDAEDATSLLTVTHDSPVNTSVEGVYTVHYTVTDTEGNATSAVGLVFVGPWKVSGDYAVKAGDFVTTTQELQDASNVGSLILELSHAEAFFIEKDSSGNATGALTPITPVVKANAGLTATASVGNYAPIRIGVTAAADPEQSVTGRVVDKGEIGPPPGDDNHNPDDPTDQATYRVGANNVDLSWAQAGQLTGKTDAVTKAALIQMAAAEAYRIVGATGAIANPGVDVVANNIQQANGSYDVTFTPQGVPGITVTVKFKVDTGNPPVITTDGPLQKDRTAQSATLTRAQLLEGVTVTDAESPELSKLDTVAITLSDLETGKSVTAIDTSTDGIYKATYTVTDPISIDPDTGQLAVVSASRLVVVGNWAVIDPVEQVVIAAKNFVVKADDPTFNGANADVVNRSGAKAYDFNGDSLDVGVVAPLPAGFTAKTVNPVGSPYPFQLFAVGHQDGQKANITGDITDGDTVVIGGDYAIIASNFTKSVEDAAKMATDADFIAAANAHIVRLTPTAPALTPTVDPTDKAAFQPFNGAYPITFGVPGVTPPQTAQAIATVTDNGRPPVLTVSTPFEVAPGTDWASVAMTGVSAIDPGEGDVTSRVTYYPTDPAKPVDTSTPGLYNVTYQVDDSDTGQAITAQRVVVVNDGRYVPGKVNILEAYSFVARSSEVPANANQIRPHLVAMTQAKAYDGTTGAQLPPSAITIGSTGGYSKTVGEYPITVTTPDGQGGPLLSKTVTGKVVDATVIDNGDNPPAAGSKVFVYGDNITLRLSEAAAIRNASDYQEALISALKAYATVTDPAGGTVTPQAVIITSDGGFKAQTGTYRVTVSDIESNCSITLTVAVTNGTAPTITPDSPIVVPASESGGTLTDAQKKGGATAYDTDDGDLTSRITVEGAVPTNVAGVYPVTLRVTDSDGNVTTATTVIVVDDGTFAIGDEYIVSAHDFTIDRSAVTTGAATAQALDLSGARAWSKADGTQAAAYIADLGGYTDVVGQYRPTIGVAGEPALTKRITATVTAPATMYLVTFNANGGTLTGPAGIYVQAPNTTVSYLPSDPRRTGYTFTGWFTAPSGGTQFTQSYPVTSNMTVYAQWEANPVPAPTPPPNVIVNPPAVNVTVPPAPASPTYVTVSAPTETAPQIIVEVPENAGTTGTSGTEQTITGNENPLGNTQTVIQTVAPEPETHWSWLDLALVILSALLVVLALVLFIFRSRNRKDEAYQEEPLDPARLAAMPPEAQAALLARRDRERQAYLEEQQSKRDKGRSMYVNAPVFLIVIIAFVEGLIILLTTQDFNAAQIVAADEYTIPLSLVVLVQLVTPMVAAMLTRRGDSGSTAEGQGAPRPAGY